MIDREFSSGIEMPYISHHFQGKEREGAEVPWGTEPKERLGVGKGSKLTTYGWMFQGQKGLPAQSYRNHTTNHFDPQNWRNKSQYSETFFTPQMYSRHQIQKFTANRNHRPHPKELIWPMEPFKGYMIWKPKLVPDDGEIKKYSAPSLLRQYQDNNWRTTNQTTYQNYYEGVPKKPSTTGGIRKDDRPTKGSVSNQRDALESSLRGSRVGSRQEAFSTPPHLRTSYKLNFTGEPIKPSTNANPGDRSWRNIRY
ncbi:uncharacterized protein [Clytia hemisphaerica]|uniref:Uncharacterized protein n=1 Tax=Clytia hemisphaerica TaxID=252671 RepID=A0A7M5XP67_9CNID